MSPLTLVFEHLVPIGGAAGEVVELLGGAALPSFSLSVCLPKVLCSQGEKWD